MSYPHAAASLARSLSELTHDRAGAHLAPSSSPASDELALHAALRARNEIAALVATIAADVAPITDLEELKRDQTVGRRIPAAEVARAMGLGRLPIVAAFTTAAREHPQIPLRTPDTDPALAGDPRTDRWISAGQHALVATTEYVRAGDAAAHEAKSWSAVTDAAALATLVTYLDTDLSTSLRAHPLAQPQALAALEQARDRGPRLAETALDLRAHTAWRRHHPYAATSPEPHQVVRVDSPESLARGQRRLASLIADVKILPRDPGPGDQHPGTPGDHRGRLAGRHRYRSHPCLHRTGDRDHAGRRRDRTHGAGDHPDEPEPRRPRARSAEPGDRPLPPHHARQARPGSAHADGRPGWGLRGAGGRRHQRIGLHAEREVADQRPRPAARRGGDGRLPLAARQARQHLAAAHLPAPDRQPPGGPRRQSPGARICPPEWHGPFRPHGAQPGVDPPATPRRSRRPGVSCWRPLHCLP